MPLPIPNLDDRRFDDLVAEARARLSTQLPELTQIAPGDPAHAFIDLFAHLTETILFRANLIPERQRRMVLNLLQIPVRNAKPCRGVVCVDAGPRSLTLPSLIRDGAQFKAGKTQFTGLGELQPTNLGLSVVIKQQVDDLSDMGLTLRDLHEQYGIRRGDTPQPFQPKTYNLGKDVLSLDESIDDYFYLALTAPKPLSDELATLRDNLAGLTLNVAIAPADDMDGEEISSLSPRKLKWELLSQDEDGQILNLPLETVADSSRGGRQNGVTRLRIPDNPQLFDSLLASDPMFAGVGDFPPELPAPLSNDRVVAWLRLSCDDEPDLQLGYLGVNGLDVIGQGLREDAVIGIGNGRPDQVVNLPDQLINPDSIILQVEEDNAWRTWQRVDFLLGHDGGDRVYRLDAVAGIVYFGDGLEGGKRPPTGKRIRIASYLHGGGSAGNLPAGEIKEIADGARLTVRHEWPSKGGVDAETVAQAERRIPQFLTHRNRAVTKQDFQLLTQNNPVNPVAKAHVLDGFLPGADINAARFDVPGAVSVFVLPPRNPPALRQTPKPSKALLKDVFEYLLQRVMVGTELYVLSPDYMPIAVGVNVDVLDAETEQQTLQAVQTALVHYLWPLAPGGARGDGWTMGAAVKPNELETQVARVDGVRAVKSLSVFQRRGTTWRRLNDNETVSLEPYQLPELLGVSAGTGNGAPAFPSGIEASESTGREVPAPVIPDVC